MGTNVVSRKRLHVDSATRMFLRLSFELLEERRLLAISPFGADPGFLAPADSPERLAAIIRLRESAGWPIEEPRLLENGNWYVGPSGDLASIRAVFNENAADTTNTDQIQPAGGLGLNLTGAGVTVGVWDEGRL